MTNTHDRAAVKNSPASTGDMSLIPGSGRYPGEGNGNPFQYSYLENPMDRRTWQATVRGVAKSQIRLKQHSLHAEKAHSASQVALVIKNLSANAGDIRDLGSIPGLGRSPGEGQHNPLQYPCLENPRDRGAWWATVHGIAKSQTQLKRLSRCVHQAAC